MIDSAGFLGQLYEVQQLDLELDTLKTSEAQLPSELLDLRAQMNTLNDHISSGFEDLDRLRKDISRDELERDSLKGQIARAREEQDKNAFDSKAQSQFENRIQQLSERLNELEETLEPLYERRETLEARKAEMHGQHRGMSPTLETLENDNDARVKALEEDFVGRKAKRDLRMLELAKADKRSVTEYEMIRRVRPNALVPIEKGRCSGCNAQVPVAIQQKASSGKPPAAKCPSCGRLLIRMV